MRRVVDAMLSRPHVLPATATVEEVRSLLDDDHVHMVLITEDGAVGSRLLGTVVASDLPDVRGLDKLDRRTVVHGHRDLDEVHELMLARGLRRLAVVDDDGVCVGLLCLKHHGRGFCSDDDVAARSGTNAPGLGTKVPAATGVAPPRVDG